MIFLSIFIRQIRMKIAAPSIRVINTLLYSGHFSRFTERSHFLVVRCETSHDESINTSAQRDGRQFYFLLKWRTLLHVQECPNCHNDKLLLRNFFGQVWRGKNPQLTSSKWKSCLQTPSTLLPRIQF